MISPSLRDQAERFATEVSEVLVGALPDAPEAVARVLGDRVVVQTDEPVPLFVGGEILGELDVTLRCRLDSRGEWLAIEDSAFKVSATLDRAPIMRFEYVRRPSGRTPGAHFQIHAHRGALSHLLSRSGHPHPHDMARLHVPVGGSRFRPCLEDVVQFLITECRFEHLPDWQDVVKAGRARWRRVQVRAVVRDLPHDAAAQLRTLGYEVVAPASDLPESDRALHDW